MFDESEEDLFEVPPGHTQVGVIRKAVPGAPKLYVFHDRNSAFLLCSLLSEFLFVGDKVIADHFKDYILSLLKEKDRVQFFLSVALNFVQYKVKSQCKLTYINVKENGWI